ncbi:FAD-dependent oxidoreductase [Aspergillus thermomutatus]|uniref:FAD-dependent oxidoreductase 2 FAD-binding domain-containing protein n=1 Tax=Aspergillus thermomutatus TaxID=41047 RepID=A0A397GEA9_ASPTH|nr:uncharacterized protein CDV56_104264 [Aspergillus thermomutatus]RHZ46420.1 hypothetical protein CDV56_104264 [Aspergillus thermomutatus]
MAISGSGPSEVAPPNSSGIKVIVVGLGMGGLAAAIECHQKGHTVSAFDKVDVRTFVHKTGYQRNDGYWALRSRLASTFFEHAQTLGIDLSVGPDAAVAHYWESHDEAGIETVSGDRFTADCVICCNGINSTGRQSILGEDSAVILTSQYVFRTSFQTAELGDIPEIKWIMEGTTDSGKVFMGPGLEIGFASFANGQEMAMAAMYNVDYAREKLGRPPDNVHDLVGLMEGWGVQGKLRNMLKHVPNNKMVHHSHPEVPCPGGCPQRKGRSLSATQHTLSFLLLAKVLAKPLKMQR